MTTAEREALREALRPGSPEAMDAGCRCPVLDNARGKGSMADGARYGWLVNSDCPLHGNAQS